MGLRQRNAVGAHDHEWMLDEPDSFVDYYRAEGRLILFEHCEYAEEEYVGTDDRGESYYKTHGKCDQHRRTTFDLISVYHVDGDIPALDETPEVLSVDDVPAGSLDGLAFGTSEITELVMEDVTLFDDLATKAETVLTSTKKTREPLALQFTDGWNVQTDDRVLLLEYGNSLYALEYTFSDRNQF